MYVSALIVLNVQWTVCYNGNRQSPTCVHSSSHTRMPVCVFVCPHVALRLVVHLTHVPHACSLHVMLKLWLTCTVDLWLIL